MLSFIYRLATRFEHAHQVRPNLLYLNPEHLGQLRESFADPEDLGRILDILHMELIVDTEVVHPHVGWMSAQERRAG
ncbi:MAG: hypothetical protein HY941_06915 [Gammaproteobacteria bacterium]|nr:hypothetical protein [Gammaproteobacteria bacterium]